MATCLVECKVSETMRRYLIPAVALLSFSACSVQPEALPEQTPSHKQKERIVITAHQEEDNPGSTRTMLDADDGATILWMAGDEINVFCGNQSANFRSTLTEGTGIRTDFEGDLVPEDGALYYGLYPYDADAVISTEGVITTSLPSVQAAVAGTFADDLFISVGRAKGSGTTLEMPFYNICSGIKFMVDRADISSLTFSANGGDALAGTFSIDFDKETDRPFVASVDDGYSTSITVTAPKGQNFFEKEVWYYIITLPVELSQGFTIEMEGDKVHASVRTSKAVTLNRSRFRSAKLTSSLYDSIDLDIEATKVREYLENTDYSTDLDAYSTSTISQYVKSSSSGGGGGSSSGGGPGGSGGGGSSSSGSSREDLPAPVAFHWASAQERTLEYATDPFYLDATSVSVEASATSTEIYNLIPGQTYYWRTKSTDGTLLNESTFVPVGPLRMIYVDGVRNVRDLGGWKGEGGATIRYGRLYRGAQFDNISSAGKETVQSTLKITADIDLRGEKTNTVGLPVYSGYGVTMYDITDKSGVLYANAIKEIVDLLRDENQVVYFHCMAGADRTGTLAFLLEALLGVSESDLSKDFELTSFYELRARNGSTNYSLNQLIPTIKGYSGATIQEKVTAWAKQNGITEDKIKTLKTTLLCPQ